MSMSNNYLPLLIPTTSIEAWLVKYDGMPRLMPSWPSDLFAVVVVWETRDGDTQAVVPLDPEALSYWADPELQPPEASDSRKLFFEIPRGTLISSGFCEGLTNASFYKQEK